MKKFILLVCGSFVGSFLAFLIFYEEAPSLSTIVKAIHVAKSESKIKGIVLNCDGAGASVATLRQLREALAEFKKDSKKWIYAYANEGYAQGDYYVATPLER